MNKKTSKHLLGKEKLAQFINTFWTVDYAQFIHPRDKVQIPFAIAVSCLNGAELAPSSQRRRTNKKVFDIGYISLEQFEGEIY